MTRQERAARTRCELVHAAAVLFEQQGFAQTTLNGICREVGVSSGALHFHFENKAAIANAIEEKASSTLRHTVSRQRPRRAGALQELIDTSHVLVAQLRDDLIVRSGVRLSHDIARQGGPAFRQEWQARVRALLEEAKEDGSLAPGVSVAEVAATVTLATVGLMALGRSDTEWLSGSSVTGFWRLVLPQLAGADFADRLDPCGAAA
ncbi:ScbR family autoregulator-binding transcription factor [Streptomyces daliensis]|uniref:TetR family transcriptional regulator n=1 Tax=Streptomyces daliensis TaxID=299421 RepID=A0A8T4IHP9_9ACTN|nr:TetR family transcriptional regulator [Streptomyces daliensis]